VFFKDKIVMKHMS